MSAITVMRAVPGDHSESPSYAVDADGAHWVAKCVKDSGRELVLAESLSWLLAMELGVPVPIGAVTGKGSTLSWLSSVVPNVAHWDEAHSRKVNNEQELGRMLTLDALIHNEDRHAANVLLQALPKKASVKAWVIDHGVARVAYPHHLQQAGVDPPAIDKLARGLRIDRLEAEATRTSQHLASMSPDLLGEYVHEACEIAEEKDEAVLLEALRTRASAAPDITRQLIERIRSRNE